MYDKDESLDTSFGRSHTSGSSEQQQAPLPRSPGERRRSVSSNQNSPQVNSGGKETDHVKVVCRVRPFNRREADIQEEMNAKLPEYERQPMRSVISMTKHHTSFLDHTNDYQVKEKFPFDENMWSIPESMQESNTSFASQETLMEKVGRVAISNAMNGYNSCILAYGQTGSGKTYSMTGTPEDRGLIPRCCEELFERIEQERAKTAHLETSIDYRVELQFLEIYNDQVKDLLAELAESPTTDGNGRKHSDKIQLRQGATGVSQVVGAASLIVTSWADCERLLEIGGQNRAFATTKMNDASSRSHAIVRLTVTRTMTVKPAASRPFERPKTFDRVSLINLVDLAGSERQKKSGAEGQQFVEACAINFSLSVLMRVIDALVSKTKPPYRECQLTWFLMESLGGNSKTFVIACVSPHTDNAEETHNTLRWALRTQGIVNEAKVNESDEARRIMDLQMQVENAKRALQENTETSKQADLLKDVEQKKSAMELLIAQRSMQEIREKDLKAKVEEEKSKTYRIRYANMFRMVLFGRMADMLAIRHDALQRQKMVMDADESTERTELDRAESELNAIRKEEAMLTQQVERLRKDQAEAEARFQETSEEVRSLDRNAIENAKKIRSASVRATCTRIWAHVTARAHAKRLQRKLDELAKQQAKEKQEITRRGNESRAQAQGAHQRSIDRISENIKLYTARIAEVEAQIRATDTDRAVKLREYNSKITFLEHENRNINDARLKMRAQLDRENSQQFDKKSTELSEENVRRCQQAEQEHKAILIELARQQRYGIAQNENQLAAATEQYSQMIADMEAETEQSLADQAATYADIVARHDAQIEDASTFLTTWKHSHRTYASVKDEVMALAGELSGSRDPEVRAMLELLRGVRADTTTNTAAASRTQSNGNGLGNQQQGGAASGTNNGAVSAPRRTAAGSPTSAASPTSASPASPTGYGGRAGTRLGSRKAETEAQPGAGVAGSAPRMTLGARRR